LAWERRKEGGERGADEWGQGTRERRERRAERERETGRRQAGPGWQREKRERDTAGLGKKLGRLGPCGEGVGTGPREDLGQEERERRGSPRERGEMGWASFFLFFFFSFSTLKPFK
jgi:hypothetical protein